MIAPWAMLRTWLRRRHRRPLPSWDPCPECGAEVTALGDPIVEPGKEYQPAPLIFARDADRVVGTHLVPCGHVVTGYWWTFDENRVHYGEAPEGLRP